MNLYVLRTVKQLIAAVPGAVWLKRRVINPWLPGRRHRLPVSRPRDRGAPPAQVRPDPGRAVAPDAVGSFVLYRIIGNDLVPRHRKGQARNNLAFILENEPELPACEKRFVVNRIVDPAEEQAIITMLEQAGYAYLHISFEPDEYREIGWDIDGVPAQYAPCTELYRELNEDRQGRVLARYYRHKNNYIMHNNGARNAALRDGRGRADWVLPWDGNCFVTASAWEELRAGMAEAPDLAYWLVPMARVTDNRALLADNVRPPAEEEPQAVFRADAELEFDSAYFYGRRPKVELFWRLGVPGQWDDWPIEPWDLPCPDYCEQAGHYGEAGWVARLFSGSGELEREGDREALIGRGRARVEAITGLIDRMDCCLHGSKLDPSRPVYVAGIEGGTLDSRLERALREAAEQALARGPYSVVDKTTLPPSGNRHDYWHPAPYFWPNPIPIPGLPYVRRDGQRVPGTRMYEPESEKYDRTRLQRLFDDTFVLALAQRSFGDEQYGEHAARLVRRWFLDPDTAMNPHLEYAQVRWGHNGNRGASSGIIEMKDLYYFLDAVRLLEAGEFLSRSEMDSFRAWLRDYLAWLQESEQANTERMASNNHGTYYDLQIASIAAFLGEYLLLRDTLRDSRSRILRQFAPDGRQPEEMERTTTAHYCCFNLQGWIHLAQLAEACGEDLWSFEGPERQGIRRAMEWLLPHVGREWPYRQIDEFDHERFHLIWHACRERYGLPEGVTGDVPEKAAIKPLFFPHDGVRPFWQIG